MFVLLHIIRPAAEAGGQREAAEGHHLHLHGSAHHAQLPVAPCPQDTPAERETPDHGKHLPAEPCAVTADLLYSGSSCRRCDNDDDDDSVSVCLGKDRERHRNSDNTNTGKHTPVCHAKPTRCTAWRYFVVHHCCPLYVFPSNIPL